MLKCSNTSPCKDYDECQEYSEFMAKRHAELLLDSKNEISILVSKLNEPVACNCDYDEEGNLQQTDEPKFKCGDDYYCRLCAEYENDVLISGECAFCIECDTWMTLPKFTDLDEEISQPCRQCRILENVLFDNGRIKELDEEYQVYFPFAEDFA